MTINTQISLLKRRRTKIVATLGPASASRKTIAHFLRAGVNVFRLNMSHGSYEVHAALIKNVRASIKDTGIGAAIMVDLCGPKIRTGIFEQGAAKLERGATVTLTTRQVTGNATLIASRYRRLHKDVARGHRILLNDGLISLEVTAVKGADVSCRVIHGGVISDNKGINLPDSAVSAPALTDKDRKDAIFGLTQDVDFLSLSFVRTASEINKLRRLVQRHKGRADIIAKIETPPALANIESILQDADAIMVARGDLGVELKPEEVPVAQLQLINRARAADRPVIVATQVLESMIEQASPTRAEISDISYAVSSSADALMLSAESSVGKHPVKSVRMMDRAIRYTESYRWRDGVFGSFGADANNQPPLPIGAAISNAAAQLSKDLLVHAIVVISRSGMSATAVSAARPSAPIIGITDRPEVGNKMRLMWGVLPCLVKSRQLTDTTRLARQQAIDLKLARSGDYILLVQGFHKHKQQNTPSVSVLQI